MSFQAASGKVRTGAVSGSSFSVLAWNPYPDCCGISIRIGVEYTKDRHMARFMAKRDDIGPENAYV